MLLALGLVAFIVVVGGVVLAIVMAGRTEDKAPPSEPTDFVAPVSSGGYRFRQTDESRDEFHARVARENAEVESQRPGAASGKEPGQ